MASRTGNNAEWAARDRVATFRENKFPDELKSETKKLLAPINTGILSTRKSAVQTMVMPISTQRCAIKAHFNATVSSS